MIEPVYRRRDDKFSVWKTLERIGLWVVAIGAIFTVMAYAAKFQEMMDIPKRVETLETDVAVSTSTEKQFMTDLMSRVDRIERKIDRLSQ